MASGIGLYEQEFTNTDSIIVNHNMSMNYIGGVRIIVNSIARNDLIKKVRVDSNDPMNTMLVELSEVCSGRLQVIDTDYVSIGQPSSSEASRLPFIESEQYYSSSSESSTTDSAEWKIKINQTYALENGNYRIGISYIWSCSSASNGREFHARVTMDGNEQDLIMIHEQRPRQANDLVPLTFSTFVENISAGNHTFNLEFKRGGKNNASVSMRDASIEIRRVKNG